MNVTNRFKSPLIHEFQPGDELQNLEAKYVYHYTSPDALLSILKENAVRFSDYRYMNDRSESIFFIKRLVEFVDNYRKSFPRFCESVDFLLARNDRQRIKDLTIDHIRYTEVPEFTRMKQRTFIFCTSNDSDSLNMWNYYSNAGRYLGYNIGLSVYDLLKSFDVEIERTTDAFIVYYGDVVYSEEQQMSAIMTLAEQIEHRKYDEYDVDEPKAMHYRALNILKYIDVNGPFYKSDKFSSENEYRILISIAEKRIPHDEKEASQFIGHYNKKMCEDFYVKNGIVIPYLKITIPAETISRITVSPMTEFDIAQSSIREVLDRYVSTDSEKIIAIQRSQIPIRY